ncbi:MAG: hypothetical protein ACE5K7_07080, partial [Phycisphaerae bacterium]
LPDLSPASLARLRLDPTRLWARCPLRAIRGLAELGVPTGPRGLFGPFDLACAARGHDLLAELLQQPAGAHRLLSLATEAAAWWARQQLAASPAPQGGTILPYFGLWLPWRAAGHVSVDYAVMVSPHLLDQFVFRYERHFASQFQAAAYHIHNVGWHTLAGVCTIERMVLLEVTDDPGVPRTAERYGQLLECAGQLPLLLYPTPQEVYDHIDLLAQHNVILSLTAANLPPDRAEQVARDLIRLVRDRSKPPAS